MPNAENQNDQTIIFDAANDTEVSDAITPKAPLVMGKRFSKPARVLFGGNAFTHVSENISLSLAVEPSQLFSRSVIP